MKRNFLCLLHSVIVIACSGGGGSGAPAKKQPNKKVAPQKKPVAPKTVTGTESKGNSLQQFQDAIVLEPGMATPYFSPKGGAKEALLHHIRNAK